MSAIPYAARALRGSLALTLPVTPQVRRDFRLDLIGAILYGVFNGAVVSYIYVVGRTIGVAPIGISLLVAMPAIGAIMALPVSMAIRGPGGRPFMIGAWITGRALILLTLLFSTPIPYVILMSLFLISTSIGLPFYASVMQHVYPREFRGRLMSLVRVGSGAATTVASLLGAWLLGGLHMSYTIVFAGGTILALVSLITFSRITPVHSVPRPRPSMRDTFGILRRDKAFAQFQLATFFMGFGNIMAATLYPLVIVDKLHGSYSSYGVLTVLSGLGYLISFFVWGRVVDRRGPLYSMLLAGILVLLPPLGMLLAPGVYWLMPVALISGVINAGFELVVFAAAIHFAAATPQDVSLYMALHSNFSGIRGLIAPFLAIGILAGHQYSRGLGCAFVIASLGTLMLAYRVRRETAARLNARRGDI